MVLWFLHLIQRCFFFLLRLVGGQELSVLREDVPFEGAVLGRPVGALGAGVGPLPRVDPQVLLQVPLFAELPAAEGAAEDRLWEELVHPMQGS